MILRFSNVFNWFRVVKFHSDSFWPKGNVALPAVYPTDLTDDQWSLIAPFFKPKKLGRKPGHERRHILNAIFYVLKGGIPWNMMPHDFPPYKVVNYYFNQWRDSGLFVMVNRILVRKNRCKTGRRKDPSVAITDSQSVRGTSFTQNDVGIDGHKKVKGRKRHLVTDVDGHILSCHVTPANTHDSKACERTIEKFVEQFGKSRLKKILADNAYKGELEDLIPLRFDAQLEIAGMDKIKSFEIKPMRWVIERTIAWLNNCRRLVRDCEKRAAASEAWVYFGKHKTDAYSVRCGVILRQSFPDRLLVRISDPFLTESERKVKPKGGAWLKSARPDALLLKSLFWHLFRWLSEPRQ